MILNESECKKVVAGGLSGNLISAVTKVLNSILDIGRACGSAIRRFVSNKSCIIK